VPYIAGWLRRIEVSLSASVGMATAASGGAVPSALDAGGAPGDQRAPGAPALEALLRPGAPLANGRGVPGTLGALAVCRHDGALVILTSHHVLFGAGAGRGEPVWLTADPSGTPMFRRAGVSLYGRLGTVRHAGSAVQLDCALATVEEGPGPDRGWRLAAEAATGRQAPRPGTTVTIEGGASGSSWGVVVQAGSDRAGPGQFLVRSSRPGIPFSVPGDSGAVVRDADGVAIGLLWGATPSGESIVTPIGAVLDVLGIRLARLVRSDRPADEPEPAFTPAPAAGVPNTLQGTRR
jgi:hypothetical protein